MDPFHCKDDKLLEIHFIKSTPLNILCIYLQGIINIKLLSMEQLPKLHYHNNLSSAHINQTPNVDYLQIDMKYTLDKNHKLCNKNHKVDINTNHLHTCPKHKDRNTSYQHNQDTDRWKDISFVWLPKRKMITLWSLSQRLLLLNWDLSKMKIVNGFVQVKE